MESRDIAIIGIFITLAIYGGRWWCSGIYEDACGEIRDAKIFSAVISLFAVFPVIAIVTGNVAWIWGELLLPVPLLVALAIARHRAHENMRRLYRRRLWEVDRGANIDPPRPLPNGSQPNSA